MGYGADRNELMASSSEKINDGYDVNDKSSEILFLRMYNVRWKQSTDKKLWSMVDFFC